MSILHFNKVNTKNIISDFTSDLLHRSSLTIPFIERKNNKTLCIIGQNPSDANNEYADKTLYYLEKFVFENLSQYSQIIMLNLFSRIDKNKNEVVDLERVETNEKLFDIIKNNPDFLLVYGASKKDGKYNFKEKTEILKPLLNNKNTFKIDIRIKTNYPPHPGNPMIRWNNFDYGIVKFTL